MSDAKTDSFYITTPIYYVNGDPHIGHAYTSLAVDTMARWHRMLGHDTYFLTGTDEHGQKIEKSAREAGIAPIEQADRFSAPFRALTDLLDLSNDDFIRTTEPRHQSVVQDIWRRMVAAGDIYSDTYSGWYSVGDEAYFTEDEVVDGKAPSGHTVEWMEEQSFFFRLSKYGPALLKHLEDNPSFVRPKTRYNEIKRFIESGLNDISVSRSAFDWGIPVPDADGHVIYVWVDALSNYISALGGPDGDNFGKFWPSAVHVIGKDILRFHAVYWPCFLMSAGLPLPKQIYAHGWWTHDSVKMSKTLGNVVDPTEMVAKYGPDPFRYFLLREITFGTDGDFSERALQSRYHGDLANNYGNLANRTLGMLGRYHQGKVPARGEGAEIDDALRATVTAARAEMISAMDRFAFQKALAAIWTVADAGNKYIADTTPWVLAKQGNQARLDEVLYTLCETLRVLGVWTQPFLPNKAPALLGQLNVPADALSFESTAEWGGFATGTQTNPPEALFPRLDLKKAEAAPKAAKQPKPAKQPKNKKTKQNTPQEGPVTETTKTESATETTEPAIKAPSYIQFEDFTKVDLRSAKIVAAEPHPNADRLLKLTVDAGEENHRTICAGIAAAYAPEDLVGKTVILVANLKPRKLRGVMSEGMLLAGGEGENVHLTTLPGDLPPGTQIT